MKKQKLEDFDFGFSTDVNVVDRGEMDQISNVAEEIRSAIQPLLDNLRKNPENDYINWPNRVEKIDEFEKHLDNIMEKR